MTTTITLVTGLPRSGTSMMMQMLAAGGCPILTDGLRPADANNPNGYLEFDPVKRLPLDSSWLPQARGKALKVVAALLTWIPLTDPNGQPYSYQAIFMTRALGEILDSQQRMLRNLNREHLSQPPELLERAMQNDLATARAWLQQHAIPTISIDYRETLANPSRTATRLATCLPVFHPNAAIAAVLANSTLKPHSLPEKDQT